MRHVKVLNNSDCLNRSVSFAVLLRKYCAGQVTAVLAICSGPPTARTEVGTILPVAGVGCGAEEIDDGLLTYLICLMYCQGQQFNLLEGLMIRIRNRVNVFSRVGAGKRFVVAAVASGVCIAGVAVPALSASAHTTQSHTAGEPTVYMVGSVTNNTFWASVQKGFLAGGKAFGVHAVYEAPNAHSSSSAIPLIQAA